MEVLLEAGANKEAKDKSGLTLKELVTVLGYNSIATLLAGGGRTRMNHS